MLLLKKGLAELRLHGGQFALEDRNKEISASARRLKETRVDALALALHQVKHLFDQPRRRKHFPVIGNASLGFDQTHRRCGVWCIPRCSPVFVRLPPCSVMVWWWGKRQLNTIGS